jgi:hypothetical protein
MILKHQFNNRENTYPSSFAGSSGVLAVIGYERSEFVLPVLRAGKSQIRLPELET